MHTGPHLMIQKHKNEIIQLNKLATNILLLKQIIKSLHCILYINPHMGDFSFNMELNENTDLSFKDRPGFLTPDILMDQTR